jgi:peptidoglycan/xylan/chitin deacetylase (PgdA/CDA1 family)
MQLGDHEYTVRKDRHKRIRTGFEAAVLLILLLAAGYALFYFKQYQAYDPAESSHSTASGFIALSYSGVDRLGRTNDLIGVERLDSHMKALRKQGYVTVTEKDIEDYYKEKKPLPKKALYLMFEDGRRDTAIFAEKLMEKYNYHATMYSYAANMHTKDNKFLSADDLKTLQESSFWDVGTNGYRLRFINVFDRYDNYLGELTPLQYAMVRSSLGRNYNHYLMDYIRDSRERPKESYEHMVSRIAFDYEQMRDVYTQTLGYVPPAYVLMHANTTQFGNNNEVSAQNEKWIRNLFEITFNREGYCFNQRNSSRYDLTRMQPGAAWSPNHLLMRIKYDINTPDDIVFETGDEDRQKSWELLKGASEIEGQQIVLTTEPNSMALARFSDDTFDNMFLTVRLLGNALGHQRIYLRADKDMKNYIMVDVGSGYLQVTERKGGRDTDLYKERLETVLGQTIPSEEEAQRDAEVKDYNTLARYASTPQQAELYKARAEKRAAEPAKSVAEGGKPYERRIDINERGDHLLHLSLRNDKLVVTVDGHQAGDDMILDVTKKGYVLLGADWESLRGWTQKNLDDDVYDGVFDGLTIRANAGQTEENSPVLYTMQLIGLDKYTYQINEKWEDILEWFLRYL